MASETDIAFRIIKLADRAASLSARYDAIEKAGKRIPGDGDGDGIAYESRNGKGKGGGGPGGGHAAPKPTGSGSPPKSIGAGSMPKPPDDMKSLPSEKLYQLQIHHASMSNAFTRSAYAAKKAGAADEAASHFATRDAHDKISDALQAEETSRKGKHQF